MNSTLVAVITTWPGAFTVVGVSFAIAFAIVFALREM